MVLSEMPKKVKLMPCQDNGPSQEQIERSQRYYQVMTRLSCDFCRGIEAAGGTVPDWAKEWWEDHQMRDSQRLNEEAKTKQVEALKAKALAKLTNREREALGL